jgi:hypothetical protein
MNCTAFVGGGDTGLIVKVIFPETPPAGAGFVTARDAVPAVAMSALVMVAVSVELEVSVVARELPFHFTVEAPTNLVPVSVSINPALPAIVDVGVMLTRIGTGFGGTAKTVFANAKNKTAAPAKKILLVCIESFLHKPCAKAKHCKTAVVIKKRLLRH